MIKLIKLFFTIKSRSTILLNKIRINDMCKMATDAGFDIVDQYIWYYDLEHNHFLTDEIKNELKASSQLKQNWFNYVQL